MNKSTPHSQASLMRLYNQKSERLYLNSSERKNFLEQAKQQNIAIQSFALTLFYTGCRVSEGCELTARSLQIKEQLLSIRSLKKRDQHHIREIPIPPELTVILQSQLEGQRSDMPLWPNTRGKPISRITAYRWIKQVMVQAGIEGSQASPKGLRHGFGIHAIASGIQLNMLQKWMGHADIKTTAIYANAVGQEEFELAKKMW